MVSISPLHGFPASMTVAVIGYAPHIQRERHAPPDFPAAAGTGQHCPATATS